MGWKRPNGFGLFDMHGNVSEWCWDLLGDYKESREDDPRGRLDGASYRVFRGGGWGHDPAYCRPAYRGGNVPGRRGSSLGFRLARVQSGR